MKDHPRQRKHMANGRFAIETIDTCRGKMTRSEIAKISGAPLNTIHGRLFRGIRDERLFMRRMPVNVSRMGFKLKKHERGSYMEAKLTESWADRKKRRKAEKYGCEI